MNRRNHSIKGQSQSEKMTWWKILPQHQCSYLWGPESASIKIPPFRPHFIKFSKIVFYEVNLTSPDTTTKKEFRFCKILTILFHCCIRWTAQMGQIHEKLFEMALPLFSLHSHNFMLLFFLKSCTFIICTISQEFFDMSAFWPQIWIVK